MAPRDAGSALVSDRPSSHPRAHEPNGAPPAAPPPGPSLRAGIGRALRHRNFQLFFGGQLVSLIGTWMQNVAQAWLIYRLTGSSLLLGAVGFCGQIPVLLLSPFGGALADRLPRRRILAATQSAAMVLAFVLAALTLGDWVQPVHILVLASVLGAVNAFDIAARQAFVVEMVGREDLANAIALNSSMLNGARIVGPAIAGVLVGVIGEGWCFFANGVSFLAVVAGLWAMRPSPARRGGSEKGVRAMLEGFRFAAHTRSIRALLLLLGLSGLTAMSHAVLLPIFADHILHGGSRGLGLLMGSTGVGALLGALVLAARRELSGLERWIPSAAAGLGVSLFCFAWSRSYWLSVALLLPVGFCTMVHVAGSSTLIQMIVPDSLRGRVMSVYTMTAMGMTPIGALLAGVLAGRLGAPVTVAIGGVILIVGSTVFASRLEGFHASALALLAERRAEAGDASRHG